MSDKQSCGVSTLSTAFTCYVQAFPNRAKYAKTAIVRYLLPYEGFNLGLGSKIELNKELDSEQSRQARIESLQQVRLEDLSDIERVLSWQAQVFRLLGASANVSSSYRSHLRHFLTWCQEQGWLRTKKTEDWTIPVFPEKSKRHGRGGKSKTRITKRHSLLPYSVKLEQLSESTQLQLIEYERFWTDLHYNGTRPIAKPISKVSCEDTSRILLQILGWRAIDKLDYDYQMRAHAQRKKEKNSTYDSAWLLVNADPPSWLVEMHKKYPPKPFNELILEDIVSIIDTRNSHVLIGTNDESLSILKAESIDVTALVAELQTELEAQNARLSLDITLKLVQTLQYNHALHEEIKKLTKFNNKLDIREKLQTEAEAKAEETQSMINDFLKWLKYQHNPLEQLDGYQITKNYSGDFCDATISLAKFLYRDITKPLSAPKYTDIPVIMSLRALRNKLRALPEIENQTHPIKRNPTWKEIGQLLRTLLIYCAPRNPVKKDPRFKIGPLRPQTSVAKDFQKYLIVMFFRLISPDRQHVVRQLRVHDTLRLCYLDLKTGEKEEAPWCALSNSYKVYYNTYTKLYYLDPLDGKDEMGNVPEHPKGKAFEWIVELDTTQTKIDKENSYRIPKIYNSELQAWLYGREDYSGTWDKWPQTRGGGKNRRNRWHCKQYNWCGYVDIDSGQKSGFRDVFSPTHNFVFTQANGKAFSQRSMGSFYENIIWSYLGIRANVHAVRSAVTQHYKKKGMTFSQNQSLADLKSHSVKMQDSKAYNKLSGLERTSEASEMIISEFLQETGLNPSEYGFASDSDNL